MIEIISDRSALPKLKTRWDELAARFDSPLLEYDWFISCLETVNRENEIRIVIIRNNNQVDAIAPLCIESRNGTSTLEIIGSSTLFEPAGLLYDNRAALKELVKAIITTKLPSTLIRIPSDTEIPQIALSFNFKNSLILQKQTAPCSYLNIQGDWQRFLDSLSSSRKYDFRRKRKCLAKEGEIRVEISTPTLDQLPELLELAFVVENKSWKGRKGSSLMKNDALRNFFENYTLKACQNNKLKMCFTYVDDKPVAMHIAIESHNAFWVLKLGYDESLAKCSPGIQLSHDTIEHCFNQKLSRYEFLGSREKWQNAWPVKEHGYYTILIFPFSVTGAIQFFKFSTRMIGKIFSKKN